MSGPTPSAGENASLPTSVDALAQAVRAVYGEYLDEAGLSAVCDKLARHRELAAAMQGYPIQNGDEPDFVFAARRQEG